MSEHSRYKSLVVKEMAVSGGKKGLESTVVGKDCILNGVVRGGLPEKLKFHQNSYRCEGP